MLWYVNYTSLKLLLKNSTKGGASQVGHSSTTGGAGSIPGGGMNTPHGVQLGQSIKKNSTKDAVNPSPRFFKSSHIT